MDERLSVPSPIAQADDPAAADAARRRLRPKKGLISSLSLPSLRHSSRRLRRTSTASASACEDGEGTRVGRAKGKGKPRDEFDEETARSEDGRDDDEVSVKMDLITLDYASSREIESPLPEDETKDVYRWAMVYENQRG